MSEHIDDVYLDGLWYDVQYDDIVSVSVDGDDVVFSDPDGRELERVDVANFDPDGLYHVPEVAVEKPVGFMTDLYEMSVDVERLDTESWAGYEYAKDRVEIVEVEENNA